MTEIQYARRLEDRLRDTATGPGAVFLAVTDLTHRFIDVNSVYCELLGYTEKELKNLDLLALVHADDQEPYRNLSRQLIAGEIPSFVLTKRYFSKTGQCLWVRENVALLRADAGVPARIALVGEDLTEQKLAQRNNTRLISVIEHSPDFIGIGSTDQSAMFVNDAGRRLVGLDGRSVGRQPSVLDYFSAEDHDYILKVVLTNVLKNGDWTGTTRFKHFVSGELIPVEANFFLIPQDKPGQANAVGCMARDIRERLAAEEALRASEATLRSFYDSAPILMGIVSVTKHEIRHIYDNPAACQFFGVLPESTPGKLATDLGMDAGAMTLWHGHCMHSLRTKKPVQFDFFTFRGGRERWLGVTVAPINQLSTEAEPELSYVAEDITERKASEFALKLSEERLSNLNRGLEARVTERTQELEKANRSIKSSLNEKEVLLKEVHHRVKNNLQVVSSLLRLQLSRLNHADSDIILQETQNRIRSMAMIHEQLYQTMNMNDINFKTYLETLMSHLVQSYSDSQQKIAYRIDAEEIKMDLDTAIPCALIATELISNAFKHAFPMHGSGTLLVELKETPPGQMYFSVQDDGVGMPAAFNTQTSSTLGFTLLTALCNQIRGKLETQAIVTGGTRFTVRFARQTPASIHTAA